MVLIHLEAYQKIVSFYRSQGAYNLNGKALFEKNVEIHIGLVQKP